MSNTKDKSQLEQYRLTGRNFDIVVRQLVEKYNASEGWAVVRVVPSPLALDVYLERNVVQGSGKKDSKEVVSENTLVSLEEVVDEKEKPATKETKSSKTTTKK